MTILLIIVSTLEIRSTEQFSSCYFSTQRISHPWVTILISQCESLFIENIIEMMIY